MEIAPTFYFRPLAEPILLSHTFNITLRNPTKEELPLFQQSIKILCHQLSEKEQRRILYTLHPLGIINTKDSLQEIFIKELSSIWIVACAENPLPFDRGLIDYGFLCGYISDGAYIMNPGGFVADINTLSPRLILRALKKELPKAAALLIEPSSIIPDLNDLEKQASRLEGLLARQNQDNTLIQIAKLLRMSNETHELSQRFLYLCTIVEILVTHNPNKENSKSPINRQFSHKLALIRHIMIKNQDQNTLYTLTENKQLYHEIYDFRSQLSHGRAPIKFPKRQTAKYINTIYPSMRLALELKTQDSELIDFVKQM